MHQNKLWGVIDIKTCNFVVYLPTFQKLYISPNGL